MHIKSLVLLGLDRDAIEVNKSLRELRGQMDSADGQILLQLAHLWMFSRGNGNGCSRAAKLVKSMASDLDEDHLALEARLVAARWLILDKRSEKSASDLIAEVYHHAVEQSYPYPMISAQIMREYHAYRFRKQNSIHALKQAAALAEANQMYGLQLEAVWVQSLLEMNLDEQALMHRQIELLGNRLSYTTVDRTYPACTESV